MRRTSREGHVQTGVDIYVEEEIRERVLGERRRDAHQLCNIDVEVRDREEGEERERGGIAPENEMKRRERMRETAKILNIGK